ncbi:hypothetical protein, partial [Burkholderia lata]|uniref:hypothetical protein n=1 Tax=Burkholderia lata (strain ATCC 17760 / DSM 23089 / LMG 22485 / NCIMB 9086 / R18194 / 383) TaxID=482957 RepID=UPI0020C63C42
MTSLDELATVRNLQLGIDTESLVEDPLEVIDTDIRYRPFWDDSILTEVGALAVLLRLRRAGNDQLLAVDGQPDAIPVDLGIDIGLGYTLGFTGQQAIIDDEKDGRFSLARVAGNYVDVVVSKFQIRGCGGILGLVYVVSPRLSRYSIGLS